MTSTPIVLSWLNLSDAAVLSGGAWQPSLPLANLQDANRAYVARSVDVLAASTQFDIDLGSNEVPFRGLWLWRHSMTQDATARVTVGTTVGGADVFTTGVDPIAVWQPVYSLLDLDFEDLNWWSGKLSAQDAALYPIKAELDFGTTLRARYIRVELFDAANPAGFIQISRLILFAWRQLAVSYAPGAGLGWQPRDTAEETLSGIRYPRRRTPRRRWACQLDALTDAEAFGPMLDMQRIAGSEGEVVLIPDPADIPQAHRRNILARLVRAELVRQARPGSQTLSLEFEEL